MVQVAVKAITNEEVQDQELEKSIAYCDKMIADNDDLGMFAMIKRGLLSKDKKFKFEDWNNGRVRL